MVLLLLLMLLLMSLLLLVVLVLLLSLLLKLLLLLMLLKRAFPVSKSLSSTSRRLFFFHLTSLCGTFLWGRAIYPTAPRIQVRRGAQHGADETRG